MVTIRKATIKDFGIIYDFINDLEDACFNKVKQRTIFNRNINHPDNTYLVAEQDGIVVGFLSCHVHSLLHHCADVAEIQEMFVVKAMRKRNIGKELLDELKKLMRKKGAYQIEVTSNKKRIPAHRFYEREKFTYTSKKFVFIAR